MGREVTLGEIMTSCMQMRTTSAYLAFFGGAVCYARDCFRAIVV
jgi:hypothetical protein